MADVWVYPLGRHERDGVEWYDCHVCGTLTPDDARAHGPAHMVPIEERCAACGQTLDRCPTHGRLLR